MPDNKNLLLERKASLLEWDESAKQSAQPVELDQTLVGRVSRIDAIQQQQMALAAQRRRKQEIQKIDAALARIESGDYGTCVKCGEDINEQRLALDPAIPTCIDCAKN